MARVSLNTRPRQSGYVILLLIKAVRGRNINLGHTLSKGEGCVKDPEEAALWFRRAADSGFPKAQGVLALWYMIGVNGLAVNFSESMRLSLLAADAGLAWAAETVAFHFELGLGVDENDDEACKWFQIAAAPGEESGTKNLIKLAHEGHTALHRRDA